jgi:hypothetical protein
LGVVGSVGRAVTDDAASVGCALAEGPVRAVGVVVLDVLPQELFELPAVPDERAVEELAAHAADPTFRKGIRDRGRFLHSSGPTFGSSLREQSILAATRRTSHKDRERNS